MSATAAPAAPAPAAGHRTIERNRRYAAWAAIALGIIAFYITLPPLLVRTIVPSLAIGSIAMCAGVWAVGGGATRLGWTGIVAGAAGILGAYGATHSGVANLERVVVWSALAAAMLRYATPLTFAAIGGVVSERGGVVNIGLEGMMLFGAFFGVYGADVTGSWLAGLLVAMASGALLALLHAVWSVTLRADQIVSGVAVNLLAVGITGYLYIYRYGEQGTPEDLAQVPDVHLPLDFIPFVGPAIEQLNLLVWLSLIAVVGVAVVIFRTPLGLRLRSVGENPLAADTAGISVTRMRYGGVVVSGVLAAMGGAFLSIGFVHSFSQNMTAGSGFIALAALIFGKWRPGPTLAAALLFGFSSALAQRLPVFSPSAATLFQALPYVLTLVAVAGLVGRSRPPAADGIPYERH
jgi:simple sugar transport system permease protein